MGLILKSRALRRGIDLKQMMLLKMIETLTRLFKPAESKARGLLNWRKWFEGRGLHSYLSATVTEFHDIEEVRWKFPTGFFLSFSGGRALSSHTPLSIHRCLLSPL